MADYSSIQKEETLKAQVFRDFFSKSKYAYEPDTGNIDFIVTDTKLQKDSIFKHHYLWAEAKKGVQDVPTMLTQLVLTIKKTYDKGDQLPPPYIGCFDTKKIAFVPFHDMLPIFHESDFNWNITPSNHETEDFQKAKKKIAKLILKNLEIYHFDDDKDEIIAFINNNLIQGALSAKNQITKNNFVHIYNKWVKEVKPFINIPKDEWTDLKNTGILDCDFYRADLMSSDGNTITEKLKIILEKDNYKLKESIKGRLFSTTIDFTDGGTAYRQFWNKYERPPAQEYQQYIIDRRDLLVPQNIREIKGSFFTPAIWVEKSQEYLEAVFGKNWQDEYVVWDCAAGTGNLLAGLVNKYNLWASTIDQPDVDTMHALIDDGFNLLHDQVFQFDFLNDSFNKLPKVLKGIINDPEKRKKLILYINPPYAEVATTRQRHGTGQSKNSIEQSKIHTQYGIYMGIAKKEIFAQFLTRIYFEIPDCKIAEFSKLKTLSGPNFTYFRQFFKAKLKKAFIVLANTFDNVSGKFPIGFKIWDTDKKVIFKEAILDVLDINGNLCGHKKIYSYDDSKFINDWLISKRKKYITEDNMIGFLGCYGNDFFNQKICRIHRTKDEFGTPRGNFITKQNIPDIAVYYAVRKCIEATWLNDRDQFLWPNDDYENDSDFINDCIVYTLFSNNISSVYGINNWIPFTEKEVNAKTKFQSNFMSNFLKEKTFSPEAQDVLNSGRELWSYYHTKIANNRTAPVDASFYDIREFFQGRSEKGTMKQKSDDETYNAIIKNLRQKLSVLAEKIQPKVYEYGFLVE
jgi:hypothetical protein